MNTEVICDIPITKIRLGRNPRTKFDPQKLQELAQSIQARGIKQPIVVEPYRKGYLLVIGERRLRAHQLLGRTTIQAFVRARTNHSGRNRFLDAVIENDQRENMTTMETARAYQVLVQEYGLTARQISKHTGRAESNISSLLVLTRLDPEIQDMIDEGFWKDVRLARSLLQIKDRETRVKLAGILWNRRATLKACQKAVEVALEAQTAETARTESKAGKHIDFTQGTPALTLSEATAKPLRWDMLRQLGRVPEWPSVIHAAERTCQACPIRDMASVVNCADCGGVEILRRLMEVGNGA